MVEAFRDYLTALISLGHGRIDNKRGRLEGMLFSRRPLSGFDAAFPEREEFAYIL
ncbi:hypothetical protein SAMN04515679_3526 [Pelosinus fermentans]|jgi:hypothetical protein|uniref:Uncharacterized protein n=1 Tax=Pelosinus fermentans B4 TaxID=1149862 RepID=I9B1J2_9FIRM|nr:hypothetical protein FB4_0532 [Pelosinus fermentans B4]EIW21783.1 hypothetical protein FA11_0590 [Pelosinus fermentans A11]MDF2571135.1 hypothetical protein [Sporomusa sp.]OAM95368.1 hypothetical protein FR7_03389 [Pelosinus fermentans DSM 17108]SDR27100.1 hypothetical protein SAMN04515679_3526 [Pelosinus fermentans]